MSIKVNPITFDEFEQRQAEFEVANFMQTSAFAKMQHGMGAYLGIEAIEFEESNKFLGQTIVAYRRHMKFFKKACIYQGPLIDYKDTEKVKEIITALESYIQKKAQILEIHSSLENLIYDDNLEVIDKKNEYTIEAICALGYSRKVDRSGSESIDQIFIKPLDNYSSTEEIFKSFSGSLRGSIKKASDSHVKVRELDPDKMTDFYNIFDSTAQRKSFYAHPIEYFLAMKANFGEKAKFLEAYLDCREYKKYIDDNIALFTEKIENLSNQPQTRKRKGQIADADDQLQSYVKRKKEFEALNITGDTLSLSSYVFMCYGKEVTFLFGGSYREYMHFGGAAMLNWEMIKYAFTNGYPLYNFYGTIETERAKNASGNYNFKKNFGGNLVLLAGTFTKVLSPIVKMVQIFRR